jgi:branched-chain amino acid transport system permease protein
MAGWWIWLEQKKCRRARAVTWYSACPRDRNRVDTTIFLFLLQDGIINGAVYALVAIATVLVFAVTRVILVPQGEFVAFTPLTIAALENGNVPSTPWLLLALGCLAAISELVRHFRELTPRRVVRIVLFDLALPVALLLLTRTLAPMKLGQAANISLAIALITPMGPMIYRIAFQPIAHSSVLVLLMAAFGVHFSLTGLGLLFFGYEGTGTAPLSSASFSLGEFVVTGQSVALLIVTALLLVLFALFFGRTLLGKALRACSSNRIGARLVGIPTSAAGQIAFALAALLGAVSGVLVGPLMTVFYDSGFLIGLKAFVAAILGGLVSYPLTVLAALGVGFAEALFSFWASNFKMPDYWITLFNYIGISSLVAIGLVLLTGVGGMTSFGQAAFVGFGAYTTGVLTVHFGISPWLTLPASLVVTMVVARGSACYWSSTIWISS